MADIFDKAFGYMPFQHHGPFENHERYLSFGGRIEEDDFGLRDVNSTTEGPWCGWTLLETKDNTQFPRLWTMAAPVFTDSGGGPVWRPASTWSQEQAGLSNFPGASPFNQEYPGKWPALAVSGMALDRQNEMVAPLNLGIVAPRLGGLQKWGSPVWDPNAQGDLDIKRRARAQSMISVYTVPPAPQCIAFGTEPAALALQLGFGRDGLAGHGMVSDSPSGNPVPPGQPAPIASVATGTLKQTFGAMTYRYGGPCHVGLVKDKHHLEITADGERMGPLHFDTGSLFIRPKTGDDAPLKFGGKKRPETLGTHRKPVELVINDAATHTTPCGTYSQLWEWQADSLYGELKDPKPDPKPEPKPKPEQPPLVPLPDGGIFPNPFDPSGPLANPRAPVAPRPPLLPEDPDAFFPGPEDAPQDPGPLDPGFGEDPEVPFPEEPEFDEDPEAPFPGGPLPGEDEEDPGTPDDFVLSKSAPFQRFEPTSPRSLVASSSELASPARGWIANEQSTDRPDLLSHYCALTESEERFWSRSQSVGREEAFAAQSDGRFSDPTTRAGDGSPFKNTDTGSGSVVFMPPELRLSLCDYEGLDNLTKSMTYKTFWEARLGFGKPYLPNGGIASGFSWGKDGNNLTLDSHSSVGARTNQMTIGPTGDITVPNGSFECTAGKFTSTGLNLTDSGFAILLRPPTLTGTHTVGFQDGPGTIAYLADTSGGVLTTLGDVLYRDGSGLQRLGIGSAGQVLTVSGGIPAWATTVFPTTPSAFAMSYDSGSFTATINTHHVVDVSSGTAEATLPAIGVGNAGRRLRISDEDGSAGTNAITVVCSGSDTIRGSASATLESDWDSITVEADNTNKQWVIV